MWSIALTILYVLFYQNIGGRNIFFLQNHVDSNCTMNETMIKVRSSTINRYTPAEKLALDKARLVFTDLIAESPYFERYSFLLRWLRARNFNVEAAFKMAMEARQWRIDNGIDGILSEKRNFSRIHSYEGHDMEGRPILLLFPTHIDLRKYLVAGRSKDLLRNAALIVEEGYWYLRNTKDLMVSGEEIIDFTVILDLHGFSIREHTCIKCMQFFLQLIHHQESYYPGCVGNYVVINVPRSAVTVAQALVSVAIETTQRKIRIFGTGRQEWKSYLLSIISADQLDKFPLRFGGSKIN